MNYHYFSSSPGRKVVSRTASYGRTDLFYRFEKPKAVIPSMKISRDFYRDDSDGVGDIFDVHFDQIKLTIQFDKDGEHKYVSNGKQVKFSVRDDLFEARYHKAFSEKVDRFQHYEFSYRVKTDKDFIYVEVHGRIGVWPQQLNL